mmetsp:Transcript_1395/g.1232  ORF Transcript_1395/g.1232 Transcript_1395/m.1232 type:complete len:159 (-) Transcript_1395:28-504(-)
MANALASFVIENELDSLDNVHIDLIVFVVEGGMDSKYHESWFKIFMKLREYLFVAICDQFLYDQALKILYMFFTTEQLKFQIYEESLKIFPKTLEVLYKNDYEKCKEEFKKFAEDIITHNEDPAFVNFFKTVILDFKQNYTQAYQESNITELGEKLSH